MTDFEHARKAMVDNQLRTAGITDRRVLTAMGIVPREEFVPASRQTLAYIDEAHAYEVAPGRALSAPAPFAKLIQLAGIGHEDHVLDVGAGTGYSSAVISHLAGKVVALESDQTLAEAAKENLAAHGNTAMVVAGPLDGGAPEQAPYDVIVIEGAVTEVPAKLVHQLKDGGRLVALISSGPTAIANLFVRSGNDVAARPAFNASLPPLSSERPGDNFVF